MGIGASETRAVYFDSVVPKKRSWQGIAMNVLNSTASP